MCGRLSVGKGFLDVLPFGRCGHVCGLLMRLTLAAGHNAFRGDGSRPIARARGALAQMGFPALGFDCWCITSQLPFPNSAWCCCLGRSHLRPSISFASILPTPTVWRVGGEPSTASTADIRGPPRYRQDLILLRGASHLAQHLANSDRQRSNAFVQSADECRRIGKAGIMATINRNKRLTVGFNLVEIFFGHRERCNTILPSLN